MKFIFIYAVFILVLILCYLEIKPMKPVDNHTQVLNQVWYNLRDNAIKHSKEEGVIAIYKKEEKIRDSKE